MLNVSKCERELYLDAEDHSFLTLIWRPIRDILMEQTKQNATDYAHMYSKVHNSYIVINSVMVNFKLKNR